jgi:hypothetical protein
VVVRPHTYRNVAYLLAGLPLGTLWFTLLVTGMSVGASLLVVALLGIPVLVGLGYATRVAANTERVVANGLLGVQLRSAPVATGHRGNLWVRLRTMWREPDRWREVGFLLLRFPAGIATFTLAVTALAVPVIVAVAPITARIGGDEPFGDWRYSGTLEDLTSSSWSWLLIPGGALLLLVAFHLLNLVADLCRRWAVAWLTSPPTAR